MGYDAKTQPGRRKVGPASPPQKKLLQSLQSWHPDCEQESGAQAHEDRETNIIDETLHHENAAGVKDIACFASHRLKNRKWALALRSAGALLHSIAI